MGSVRVFVAFDTPLPIREAMRILQAELKNSEADVRWEPVEKLHATIKFLGSIQENILPGILDHIRETVSSQPCFEVTYASLGAFPSKRHPRVIWIGCENADGKLLHVKNELDKTLLPFRFPIEERTFHPHITLGRVKSESGNKDLLSMLESLTFEPHSTRVEKIVVMKSILKPQGSAYSMLTSISLTT